MRHNVRMALSIPVGYEGATPYLRVRGAAAAIEFYKKAFGAVETARLDEPGGRVGHAEIAIGKAKFMLSDEYPEHGITGPATLGGTSVSIHLYVEDVDAFMARAEAAGGKVTMPPKDQFFGDRSGKLLDPFGHDWYLATHKEDMTIDEMKGRYEAMMKG